MSDETLYAPADYPQHLAKHIRRELERGGKKGQNIPLTDVWGRWVLTSGGRQPPGSIEGSELFFCNPWEKDKAPVAKKPNEVPQVLSTLLGWPNTQAGEIYDISSYTGNDQEVLALLQACQERGITQARLYNGRRIEYFWESFFAAEHYLDVDPDDRTLPDLVVTDGDVRSYGSSGGYTFDGLPRLKSICEECGVPLVVLPRIRR